MGRGAGGGRLGAGGERRAGPFPHPGLLLRVPAHRQGPLRGAGGAVLRVLPGAEGAEHHLHRGLGRSLFAICGGGGMAFWWFFVGGTCFLRLVGKLSECVDRDPVSRQVRYSPFEFLKQCEDGIADESQAEEAVKAGRGIRVLSLSLSLSLSH